MARDYKNAGTRRRGPKSGGGFNGWIGLTMGLTLGVALAASVHLYHTHPDRLVDDTPTRTADDGASATVPATDTQQRPRPRFDFYRMLPNYEMVIPEEDIAVTPTREEQPVASTGNYVLQAGSFRSATDADRLRAQLALLGIESRVQTVTIDGSDTWHRVRIGPIRDLAELNQTRQKLARNQVEALVIRVGD